jgi:lysophospholipase L1-like esterase
MATSNVVRSWFVAVAAVSAVAVISCSSSSGNDAAGGAGGAGGAGDCPSGEERDQGSGDCVASNGGGSGGTTPETGGSTGTGGTTSPSGGTGGTMGTAGSSGMAGKGGMPGTAGMGGTPAVGGTGGTPPVASAFPCKANCKVLVVGDGLAAGTGSGGAEVGYRNQLKTRLGAQFTFVGSTGMPAHEGLKGRNVAALLTALPGFIATHKPDLIIINIGSEDALTNLGSLTAAKVMAIVDKAVELAPNAGVLVTSPPPFNGVNTANLQTFSLNLAKAVKVAIAANKHVDAALLSAALIKYLGGPPDSGYLSTAPYPNAAGYKEIGDLIVGKAAAMMKL